MKEALRLLKNNLVMAPLVHRNMEKQFGKVGDSVQIKLPYRTRTASGRVLVKQPMTDLTTNLSIDNQEHFGIEYTAKDLRLDIMDFSDRYLKSGIVQIANVIDRSILLTMKNTFHSSLAAGGIGTRPGAFIDFANAGAKQTTYAVPSDGMRHAVLNPFTCAQLSDEVTKLFNPGMVEGSYKKNYLGDVAGYGTYDSQNIPTHLVGDHGGTPLNDGAGSNGSTITIKGGSLTTTDFLLAGDVFTVAGVFGVNPQSYASTGILQEFVVQADVSTDGSGDVVVSVFPELNDGNATITNADGQTVSTKGYQNINALPADNAPIVVLGAANTEYEQNFLFHRDAVALAMIQFEIPKTAVVAERVTDPDTGLSLMMTGDYDITEQTEIHRIDALWGTKAIYPELALRLWGQAL